MKRTNKAILNKTDDNVIHAPLYGGASFQFTTNASILKTSVEYVLAAERLPSFLLKIF